MYFRPSLVIVEDVGTAMYDYEIFYVINKYSEWKRSSRAIDIVFERAVSWYWFECVEVTDQDHVTMNRWDCKSRHLCEREKVNKRLNCKSFSVVFNKIR